MYPVSFLVPLLRHSQCKNILQTAPVCKLPTPMLDFCFWFSSRSLGIPSVEIRMRGNRWGACSTPPSILLFVLKGVFAPNGALATPELSGRGAGRKTAFRLFVQSLNYEALCPVSVPFPPHPNCIASYKKTYIFLLSRWQLIVAQQQRGEFSTGIAAGVLALAFTGGKEASVKGRCAKKQSLENEWKASRAGEESVWLAFWQWRSVTFDKDGIILRSHKKIILSRKALKRVKEI